MMVNKMWRLIPVVLASCVVGLATAAQPAPPAAPKAETGKMMPAPKAEAAKMMPAPKAEAAKMMPAPKAEAAKMMAAPKAVEAKKGADAQAMAEDRAVANYKKNKGGMAKK